MDGAGQCTAAVGFGFPAIDFFLNIDGEGGTCNADTVVAITRERHQDERCSFQHPSRRRDCL